MNHALRASSMVLIGGGLLLGCGPPPEPAVVEPPPPPRVRLNVHFSTLEVIDDYEGGKGDWRVTLRVDGEPLGEPIKGEAGAGASVSIDREVVSEGLEAEHQLVITVKVEEWDGGFDSTWELIGEETRSYAQEDGFGIGGQHFAWDMDEGNVKLHYQITAKKDPVPPPFEDD